MKKLLLALLLTLSLPSFGHAALIERIMGEPGFTKISVHTFFALNHERIEGRLTRQNVIDLLGLAGDDITEYDALVVLAPTGTAALNVAQKAMYLNGVHAVFMLAEVRVAGYDTLAAVRGKLGLWCCL